MTRQISWAVFAVLFIFSADHAWSLGVKARPTRPTQGQARIIRFDVVVRAYCPCRRCCSTGDGRTATNRKIRKSDYIVAISPDLETYLTVSNETKLHVPGYDQGRGSLVCDRTARRRTRQIEVLMTVWKNGKSPHRRALLWGHKNMEMTVRVGSDNRVISVSLRRK